MHMTVMGCGTIIQHSSFQNCSGYLIDKKILFDCGPGVWRALNEAQLHAGKLHHIVLSHFHVDHTADLAPFLMARYLMLDETDLPLSLTGPVGIHAWFENLKQYCGSWVERIPVHITGLQNKKDLAGYRLVSGPAAHTESCLCYRLEDTAGSTFFYSGDSDETDAIRVLARNCDLAVIESSNTEETKVEGHLTPGRAARLAAQAGVKTLMLTHMYPEVTHAHAQYEAQKYFSGKLLIARDGLNVTFNGN